MRETAFAQSISAIVLTLSVVACTPAKTPSASPVVWAYPGGAPGSVPVQPEAVNRIPGSALALTAAQVTDEMNPPDWFPQEHPAPPAIVAHGRPDGPIPCGECHLISGHGFQGTPDLAGVSSAYIVEQVQEFRAGRRRSAVAGHGATAEMVTVAAKVSDADLTLAAAYFAALPRRPWYRVVETDKVPVTRPNAYGWRDLVAGVGSEPIAGRIIEVPEDTRRTFLSDPHLGVVAYAPVGAVERGKGLAVSGGPAGQPCASCHGEDLRGVGDTPPLAGRSPAYLARMLWDIKAGARKGSAVALMQPPAKGLSEADITDIAAYLASLQP